MAERKFVIKTNDGYMLDAVEIEAHGNHVALMLHGITVNKNEYLDFFKDASEYLKDYGIGTLRIDFRGHGESSGTSKDFTVSGQVFDTAASIEYIKKEHPNKNISIVGCSFGAPPAIFAAEHFGELISQLILIAPVLSYKDTFLSAPTEWAKSIFTTHKVKNLGRSVVYFKRNFPISKQLIGEMMTSTPDLVLQRLTTRTTIVHGRSDSMVPYSTSKRVSENSSHVTLHSFNDMDHGFVDVNDETGVSDKSLNNRRKIYEIIKNSFI